jgi:hypothetical protein
MMCTYQPDLRPEAMPVTSAVDIKELHTSLAIHTFLLGTDPHPRLQSVLDC